MRTNSPGALELSTRRAGRTCGRCGQVPQLAPRSGLSALLGRGGAISGAHRGGPLGMGCGAGWPRGLFRAG